MIEKLTLDVIRRDNPHFGPKIHFVEFEKFEKPSSLGFRCAATFGAKKQRL